MIEEFDGSFLIRKGMRVFIDYGLDPIFFINKTFFSIGCLLELCEMP